MNKTVAGLIQHCKEKLGTPYIYGAKSEVLTQGILDRLARENPRTYTSTYKAKAAKYIGQRGWYQFTDGIYAANGWYWLREAVDGTCSMLMATC